jgi:hypothetical protein
MGPRRDIYSTRRERASTGKGTRQDERLRAFPTETSSAGFPSGYPAYEVITVNGMTDIIEHRKMEPMFYMTDDPAVWKELGVTQK